MRIILGTGNFVAKALVVKEEKNNLYLSTMDVVKSNRTAKD
jgi:hypothetical protein